MRKRPDRFGEWECDQEGVGEENRRVDSVPGLEYSDGEGSDNDEQEEDATLFMRSPFPSSSTHPTSQSSATTLQPFSQSPICSLNLVL